MNEEGKDMLVLGAEGIAGSAILRAFPKAVGTTRSRLPSTAGRILDNIDVTRPRDLREAIAFVRPRTIVNCVGIVKSECDKYHPDVVRAVNGETPHVLAQLARLTWSADLPCRVIHLSTDCVFDGSRGGRTESDSPDATDLYGRTKAAGELVGDPHCVTLRTSFIGHDPIHRRGLLAWLLDGTDPIDGYTEMWWSGLSAPELARVVGRVAADPSLRGLYQVAGPVISKADLLTTLLDAFGRKRVVRRVEQPRIDRTMNGDRFERITNYKPPAWTEMAKELATG